MTKIGLDPKDYGSHSGRIGSVTEAYKAGVPEEYIRQHGQWKSDTMKTYFKDTSHINHTFSAAILKTPKQQ